MELIGTYFYICVDKFPLVTLFILRITHTYTSLRIASSLYPWSSSLSLCSSLHSVLSFSTPVSPLSLPSSCRIFTHVTMRSNTLLSLWPTRAIFRSLISLFRLIFHISVAFTLLFFSSIPIFLYYLALINDSV